MVFTEFMTATSCQSTWNVIDFDNSIFCYWQPRDCHHGNTSHKT